MTVLCPGCESEALPLYDPNDSRITNIPVYCGKCEALWVDGKKIDIEEEANRQFKIVSEETKKAATEVKDSLIKNPEDRIQKYFERVFYWAFAEGFLRAYAYFKHARTGRFRRIKELWVREADEEGSLSEEELQELDKLIRWTK